MATLPTDLTDLADVVIRAATKRGMTIATAESCTGGLISSCLTALSLGLPPAFLCGFITYCERSQNASCLAFRVDAIAEFGAVSDMVAAAMAEGALAHVRRRPGCFRDR